MPVWERESERESLLLLDSQGTGVSEVMASKASLVTQLLLNPAKKNNFFFFCPVIPLTLCILSKCPHLSLTYGYNDNMYVFFIYTPSLKARSSNNWTKSADLCQAARFITYSDRERESERERKRARAPWPMIFGMSKVNHLFHNLFSTFAKNFINSRWELFKLSGRQIDRPTDRQMP